MERVVMNYLFLVPLMETIAFNVVALNYCFKKRFSSITTILIFCSFSVIFFLPWEALRNDIASGDGKFAVAGLAYIVFLKLLYREKLSKLFLAVCMTWVYTQGIISFSTQFVGYFFAENKDFILIIFESVALLAFMIPFRKFIIPKYNYIFTYMQDLKKAEIRNLAITVYINLSILFLFHAIFLEGEPSIMKILVLGLFLVANYFYYAIIYDVTSNFMKIDQLEIDALQDSLTHLGNRDFLMKSLNTLIAEEREFSVVFLDLDKFKEINDRYGHEVGDQYLIHFGDVCSMELGENGKLFRYGGDEFVALYYGSLSEDDVKNLASCRQWNHGAPCEFNKVSAGLVVCKPPFEKVSFEELLKKADSIMYENKMKKKAS